jgi:small-conductance mechanosensitive channel
VAQVLRGAIDAVTGLSRAPAPGVQFTGFGANSLDFEVTAWAPDFDSSGGLRSELASRIYAALDEAGIRIPVPRQELHLRTTPDALMPAPPQPAPR